jgi:hypothetical protein
LIVPEVGRSSLDPSAVAEAVAALREANLAFAQRYPGEGDARQPVHTFIEGAQHFSFDVARLRGQQALASLDEYAPTAETLGRALGFRDIQRSMRFTTACETSSRANLSKTTGSISRTATVFTRTPTRIAKRRSLLLTSCVAFAIERFRLRSAFASSR